MFREKLQKKCLFCVQAHLDMYYLKLLYAKTFLSSWGIGTVLKRGFFSGTVSVCSSVNHVVRMCTYFDRISKMGDTFYQKYYPIRTFAHCTYPVRMYVCVHIVSICKYLHVSKFMSLRNTYIYIHIRAILASKDIHTYTYIYLHILTYTYIYVQY